MYNLIFKNGNKVIDNKQIEWVKHPKFKGVFMKDVLTGKDTDNKISVHIVKIEPDCEIGNHIHEGKAELHEVIDGQGVSIISGKEIEYYNGVVSYIPEDIPHSVKAGEKGLMLLAKFTPSLN